MIYIVSQSELGNVEDLKNIEAILYIEETTLYLAFCYVVMLEGIKVVANHSIHVREKERERRESGDRERERAETERGERVEMRGGGRRSNSFAPAFCAL